jgi:hypothetical protein
MGLGLLHHHHRHRQIHMVRRHLLALLQVAGIVMPVITMLTTAAIATVAFQTQIAKTQMEIFTIATLARLVVTRERVKVDHLHLKVDHLHLRILTLTPHLRPAITVCLLVAQDLRVDKQLQVVV